MEAFSLLKYWRGGGGAAASALNPSSHTTSPTATATATATVLTAVPHQENATDSDEDGDGGGGDDGPFFDLEFTVPDEVEESEDAHENTNSKKNPDEHHSEDEEEEEEEEEEDEDDDNIEECEREFKFTLSPSSNDRSSDDPNLSLSPSEDLFFKGKLVHVDPSSSSSCSEPNSKAQFTASLLKSATKFRVFMLGLKKPKPNTNNTASSTSDKDSSNGSDSVPPKDTTQQPHKRKQQPERKLKHFTVKFKVEEVPIMSLFTRDNSSKGNNGKKHNPEDSPSSSSEEKRSSKEVMNKYLKMVKPLYIRVSRRYGDKLGFSGQLSLSSSAGKSAPLRDTAEKKCSPAKAVAVVEGDSGENRETMTEKQGNLPSGLRIACKRLGKSRSASSAVAAAPPALLSSKRRDDSLLQQQDGIQGAILHCKRSFNASRSENEACEVPCSVVSEMTMPSSSEVSRKSTNEGKDKRI